jgi:D-serine deaminase-like pyridoxal phosphate-dependent protein
LFALFALALALALALPLGRRRPAPPPAAAQAMMSSPARLGEVQTPALIVDADTLDRNLATMAGFLPGPRLRPHVKAHKCTALARRQLAAGHHGFTCATIREVEGMTAAGLAEDLLLANEVTDASRLDPLIASGARITVAVDSPETVEAAAAGGVREVVIDVNVGLARCGCPADEAGRLADLARSRRLDVRGVMGYEGHAVGLEDRAERARQVAASMAVLMDAHQRVGGELITAGGTGSYDLNPWANEIQAGSYALMDSAYGRLGLPFGQALTVLATVISVNRDGWAVADCGLKALGMDHGNPSMLDGSAVWFCSDEHITFSPAEARPLPAIGSRVHVVPAHVDPTVAYHTAMYGIEGSAAEATGETSIAEVWPVDLRGW